MVRDAKWRVRPRRQDDQRHICAGGGQIAEIQDAVAFFSAQIARCQQPGQPPPAAPRGGIGNDVGRAIGKYQPRARHKAKVRPGHVIRAIAQRPPGAHHACHAVAVGNAQPALAKRDGLFHHRCRGRGAAQKGKMGGRHQLGIAIIQTGHADTSPDWFFPCRKGHDGTTRSGGPDCLRRDNNRASARPRRGVSTILRQCVPALQRR